MGSFDILVIGGGAAGICAAKAAYSAGCRSIALVDSGEEGGGVLLQCAHRGFGREQTGGEYAAELMRDFPENIDIIKGTTVLSLSRDKRAILSGGSEIAFKQLILATGCREIPAGALPIAGTRPAGVYTAGQMQEMMNLYGVLPSGPVVILGSGDLGLIMARQLSELGLPVTLVEREEQCGGMARNRAFLKDGSVELICSATVSEIYGEKHIERVRLSNGRYLPCATLLIAVGLVPERELALGLEDVDWLQLCGNCKSVHPMVEGVCAEGTQAGITAYERIKRENDR